MESVSREKHDEYLSLCKDHERFARECFDYTGDPDFPDLSHQFFICLRDEPLTETEWAKLVMYNDCQLPKEVAAWSEWDRSPCRTRFSRYYGLGDRNDVKEFIALAKQGQTILRRYVELDVPEQLAWNLLSNPPLDKEVFILDATANEQTSRS